MTFIESLLWLRDHNYPTLIWPDWAADGCVASERHESVLAVIEREQRFLDEQSRGRWPQPTRHHRHGGHHYLIEVARTRGGDCGAYVYEMQTAPTQDVSCALEEDSILPPELLRENVLEDFPGWRERPYSTAFAGRTRLEPRDHGSAQGVRTQLSWARVSEVRRLTRPERRTENHLELGVGDANGE